MKYLLRAITREEHLAFVARQSSVSHLQIPSWGEVKSDWRPASLGWFDDRGRLVGAGLVLLRPLPKVRRYLAYLPEGPVVDWASPDLEDWLRPMIDYLSDLGAFTVRMGPPVVVRRWDAPALRAAVSDPEVRWLREAPPSEEDPAAVELAERLQGLGWRPVTADGEDSAAVNQPRYVFQVPFRGRPLKEVQQGFSQEWRRSAKKAWRSGVEVVRGGYEELPAFHRLYARTAERDGFLPRPLPYFRRMWIALRNEHPDRMRLYLSRYEGEDQAAALMLAVGDHVWHAYGAAPSDRTDVSPDHALQWRMIADAHEMGADLYDLRGIRDAVAGEEQHLALLRHRLGTGGQAVEYLGEWDFPISRVLHKALDLYIAHRGA
ncbi:peptidoglycan bridge formation glycyltransferase FemA/FemB family protein [Streptomyces sp. NPDC047130]|uniref:lipid II:glycine glycyltransferase FemX n=1 Tax=Streptomyces sp. NPDC047130 TaxID=3155261 RepID=UPI0033FB0F1F